MKGLVYETSVLDPEEVSIEALYTVYQASMYGLLIVDISVKGGGHLYIVCPPVSCDRLFHLLCILHSSLEVHLSLFILCQRDTAWVIYYLISFKQI